MNTNRQNALSAGVLFVIADIAGVLAFAFLGPVYNPDYLIKVAENRNLVITGALMFIVGLSVLWNKKLVQAGTP